MGEILNKGQSSSETRCIKILINKDEYNESDITLSSQLDRESTIRILEACLLTLRDQTPQNGSTNGKGK